MQPSSPTFPDRGGHKFLRRAQSTHNARQTAHRTGDRGDRAKNCRPKIGIAFTTTRLMNTFGWPTPRSTPTRRPSPRSPWRSSPSTASPSSASCPTTGRPIAPTTGATPAPNCTSPTRALARMGIRRSQILSDGHEPCSEAVAAIDGIQPQGVVGVDKAAPSTANRDTSARANVHLDRSSTVRAVPQSARPR
jgi:hypothetical protein